MAAPGAPAPRRRTRRRTRRAPAPTTTCATPQYSVRGEDGVGFAPNARAPANYQYTYLNNGGTLPSFQLVGNQDLFTSPSNGFFKSHWAFADTTEAENWAVRGDLQFDPPFIESGGVTFSAGLRLANREIDYEFGRFLADYSGQGELDGSDFGQNWTPFGYFQDGAIGYKSCEIPASAGANFQFAPCERFGNSPALITPYQTFTGSAGRVETINGFWANGHITGNSILVQNRSQMSNALAWIQGLYPDTEFGFFPSPLETFAVEEKTTSAYLMADVGEAVRPLSHQRRRARHPHRAHCRPERRLQPESDLLGHGQLERRAARLLRP